MIKMLSLFRRARMARPLLAIAALVCSGAALADDLPQVISPLQDVPERNGVNLTTGKILPPVLTLSVPGSARLKYDRAANSAPMQQRKWTHNFDGSDGAEQQQVHTADGVSERFSCLWDQTIPKGKSCESATGTGSSITYNGATYRRAGSGEVYTFNVGYYGYVSGQPGEYDQNGYMSLYASRVTYPDGEVISYTYESAPYSGYTWQRPTRISSNLGFFILVTYQGSTVGQSAWQTPASAAIYSEANPTQPIRKFTYSGGNTTDVSDPALPRLYKGYFPGTLGREELEQVTVSQTLPGDTTATLSSSAASNVPLVGTVVRDGVSWSYSYLNPSYLNARYKYDRIYLSGPNGYASDIDIIQKGFVSITGTQNVVASRTDELNRKTSFDYDDYLRLTKITYPELNSVSIQYDLAGNVIRKITAPKPNSGLANLVEDAFVDLTPYYDTNGFLNCRMSVKCYRMDWIRDARGKQTDFVYNSRGQVTEQIDPADDQNVRRKTITEYEEYDTGYTHDDMVDGTYTTGIPEYASRRKVVRTCGVGTTCGVSDETRTEYDYWGNTYLPSVERRKDPATGEVRETKFSYDNAGRVTVIDGPLKDSDGAGPGTDQDDAQYFLYDNLGRKTWEIGPVINVTSRLRVAKFYTYRDSDDKVTRVQTGTVTDVVTPVLTEFDRSDIFYDSRRNAVRERRTADGEVKSATDRTFLPRGLPECTAVRMNPTALPALGTACVAGSAGSEGADRIVKNVYDNAGQLVQVREGVGSSVEGTEATYDYTGNGKRKFVIDGNGNRAELVYDGHDRLQKWVLPSKTRPSAFNDASQSTALSTAGSTNTADYEQYSYDSNGNRLSLRKRDGSTITYAYDDRNQMIRKYVPERAGLPASATRDVFYIYDINGLMTRARFDSTGGEGITSEYNGFGELKSSRLIMDGSDRTLRYAYSPGGKRTLLTHADGQKFTYRRDSIDRAWRIYEGDTTVSTALAFMVTYNDKALPSELRRWTNNGYVTTELDYDPALRLSYLKNNLAGTSGDLTITQEFNPASQIKRQVRVNDAFAWTGASTVNRNYTTNGLNQYTAAGSASFTYDANGNLTSDGSSTFVYDVENRLVSASGAKTANLVYDPMGRLFRTDGGTTVSRIQFLYDGDELVAEYDYQGTMARRYVHSDNADDPVIQYNGNQVGAPNRNILMTDERGSIVALVGPTGANDAINAYDEYGIPRTTVSGASANGVTGRFAYTGQIWLPELGMYHYKARIYSPTLGRFLQVDPIGYDDQTNLYAYVGNDPMNASDPAGTDTCTGSNINNCPDGGVAKGFSGKSLSFVGPMASQVGTKVAEVAKPGVGLANGVGAAVAGSLLLCGDTPGGCVEQTPTWFITYTKSKTENGKDVVYSGRTSGRGNTAQEVLDRRDRGHHMNRQGFGPARIDRAVRSNATLNDSYARMATRGREQMMIDHFGGARSSGGTSGNAINGISPYNPLKPLYLGAAISVFGNEF